MHGPATTSLGSLASLQASTTVSIGVDGPYGNDASVVKQLQCFDRVLLLAGGVGATAILPLYRYIRTASSSTPVRLLWAVREASELMWAENILRDSASGVADKSKVRLFVTRGERGLDVSEGGNEAPGLESSKQLDDISSILAENEIEKGPTGVGTEGIFRDAVMSPARPDLQSEVDEMFGQDSDERVAVVVCGPATMVDDLRAALAFWIEAGRDVYFDKASFSL
jgi:NAD(P)H-flavin reductase